MLSNIIARLQSELRGYGAVFLPLAPLFVATLYLPPVLAMLCAVPAYFYLYQFTRSLRPQFYKFDASEAHFFINMPLFLHIALWQVALLKLSSYPENTIVTNCTFLLMIYATYPCMRLRKNVSAPMFSYEQGFAAISIFSAALFAFFLLGVL